MKFFVSTFAASAACVLSGRSVSAQELLIAGPGPDATDFTTSLTDPHTSYGTKDTPENAISVSADGLTATLEGNTWRAIPLPSPHEVTYYTRLEFELRTHVAGQYSCVGLGSAEANPGGRKDAVCDGAYDPSDGYRLHWGSYDEFGDDETAEAHWVKYVVHLGQTYGGEGNYGFGREVTHLILALRNEQLKEWGKISFRNIAIVEPSPVAIMNQGTLVTSDMWVRYHKRHLNSWPEGDYHFPDTSPDGTAVTMKGNTHVAYPLPGVHTGKDTVLKVRAHVRDQPEHLLMCLENDDSFEVRTSKNGCFRFAGTHSPDSKIYYRGFPQLSSGQGYDYYFKLAEFKTGPVDYLSFVHQKRHDGNKYAASTISNVELVDAAESCLLSLGFALAGPECTVDVFLSAIRQDLESNGCPNTDPVIEMMAMFPELSLKSDVEDKIQSICSTAYEDKYLPFDSVTGEDKMYTVEVLDGGTDLNYMRQADEAFSPFDRILDVVTDHRTSRPISWPDTHSLRKCSLGAAMCCTVSNRMNEGDEPDPVDNSDACYMDFTDSRQSSHVRDGYAIYGDGVEGPLYCHGFAWGDDAGYQAAALRGSALFEVAMYKGLYVHGNAEELPGASMCGCVEQMPVVTEAACTKVAAVTTVTVVRPPDSHDFAASLDISDISYEDCGDLGAHYGALHADGFVTDGQKYEFDRRVVGRDGCLAAIHSFLKTKGYEYPLPQEPAPAPVTDPELGSFPFEYTINVAAKFGAATQSSVCHGGIAKKAVDEDTSSYWNNRSIVHTCYEWEPWWMVDFSESPGPVDRVIIHNRMDWGQDKISGVRVEVLDADGSATAVQYVAYVQDLPTYTLEFNGVFGSAVRLSRPNTSDQMHVAEVEVIGVRGSDTAAPTSAPTIDFPKGVLMETWWNIAGVSVDDFRNSDQYLYTNPGPPEILETLETSGNDRGNYFGSRLCTYIVPPEDGDYKLFISSDDYGQLWFNPEGEDKDGMEQVAYISGGWSPKNNFYMFDSQQSRVFTLEAHTKYYLEAFYKEHGGGDHIQVAWAHGGVPPQVIPSVNTWLPESCSTRPIDLDDGNNRALVDYYMSWGGSTLGHLFGNPNFPDSPTSTSELLYLEISANQFDNYGVRIRSFIVAPVTGEYTFYISSDDQSRLFFRDSDVDTSKFDYENHPYIAHVPDWTASRQWAKFPDQQKSIPIQLVEGQKYYVEAIMKEGGGGDNLAVGWKYGTMTEVQVIGGLDIQMPE